MGNGCTLKLPWPYSEDRNAARILRHEFVGADPGRAPLPASWSSGNLFPPYSWKHLGKNHQKRIEIIHCSQESFKHVETIFCIAFAFFLADFLYVVSWCQWHHLFRIIWASRQWVPESCFDASMPSWPPDSATPRCNMTRGTTTLPLLFLASNPAGFDQIRSENTEAQVGRCSSPDE